MQIVKVPGINGLGKTNGCEKAGNAILQELKNVWSKENGQENYELDELDLEEIHLNNSNLEEANKLIYENALEALSSQDKVIFLGGDHSISYSLGKAFLDFCKEKREKACLIVFDAHPDCMPASREPTHEEWLRKLVEQGFPRENIMLIGIRNSDKEEIDFIKKNKIKIIPINDLLLDIEEMTDVIMEFSQGKKLYISIDIDVVDPAFAPATSYLEPGGLTSRQILYIVQRLALLKNLKVIDIVEINPTKPGAEITVKLGAKILTEFL